MFFFEKKNQKTFVCSDTRRGNVSDRGDGAGIKVFWFFFSKKNTFLRLSFHRRDGLGTLIAALSSHPCYVVFAVGLTHRFVLWLRLRSSLLALMSHAPGNQTMQLMPMQIYQHSFWTGLWLLQQTPPVPHLIYRLVLLAGGWPFRTAEILCAMQGIISLLAGVLLCSLIRRLVNSNAIALLFSMWFLLSTDLLVTEYAFYGQMFYEDLGMLGTLACCWQACRLAQRNDADTIANSGVLGTLAALTALTRSSLNFFPLAILPGAVMFLRTRSIVAIVLPILVLQGGWAAKNWVALNRFTVEDSSWTGMNMAKGVFWANQDLLILKDIADAPSGIYPPWFQAIGHHYTFPFEVSIETVSTPEPGQAR